MAAKKVDPLKAKAAKQKKIAIGGFVLLAALGAIQGPKTLKMLSGPQGQPPAYAVAQQQGGAAPAPATPGAPAAPAAPGGTAAGAPPAAPAAELASVPDSDQPPVVDDGQLATFERFASKDPFAQQAQPVKPATTPVAEPAKDGDEPAAGEQPAGGAGAEGAEGEEAPADGGFTTGGSAPPAVEIAATTSIAVNGTAEDVQVDAEFPTAEPTFLLVELAKDGKSVEIGIAGGSYANGEETLKLTFGKKITLQNTADGSRYELELLSVAGFPLPKKG